MKKAELTNPKRDVVKALHRGMRSPDTDLPAVIVEISRGSLYNDSPTLRRMFPSSLSMLTAALNCLASGASAISINVDTSVHRGNYDDLENVKKGTPLDVPVICNDFVVYAYQLFQAKASGADAIK